MFSHLAEINWDTGKITMVMVFAIPITAILSGVWYKVERMRSQNDLKRRMVDRGMSVEEIERVMKAGPPPHD